MYNNDPKPESHDKPTQSKRQVIHINDPKPESHSTPTQSE